MNHLSPTACHRVFGFPRAANSMRSPRHSLQNGFSRHSSSGTCDARSQWGHFRTCALIVLKTPFRQFYFMWAHVHVKRFV